MFASGERCEMIGGTSKLACALARDSGVVAVVAPVVAVIASVVAVVAVLIPFVVSVRASTPYGASRSSTYSATVTRTAAR